MKCGTLYDGQGTSAWCRRHFDSLLRNEILPSLRNSAAIALVALSGFQRTRDGGDGATLAPLQEISTQLDRIPRTI